MNRNYYYYYLYFIFSILIFHSIGDEMKPKDRLKPHRGSARKLGFVSVFALCLVFFFAGFFGARLFNQKDISNGDGFKSSVDRSVEDELDPMAHGETGDGFVNTIPFQVLSWKPRVLYFPNFATAEQCESIVNGARPKLKPSMLALRKGDDLDRSKGTRTSSGVFISAWEDDTLDYIEQKISKVTMIPRDHGEAFNVLRYELGQKYDAHYDAFLPKHYGIKESQRLASFLLYLTDVEEGGETMFPYENGANMGKGYNYKDCIGLKVEPRRGDGLLFYSLLPNGTIDMTSLHGSCPVIKGEKWVATKWLRNTTWV
uniref:procollagen-proline 4-dioxygenase n=1 Tax=Kalanchoe fedtschenkoi TaxID=63787 RepID=A0A7N0TNJ0_KALFE